MAWSYLIRYKLGETIPDRAVRPFRINSLLAWLAGQLQLVPAPTVANDPLLHANQETLQEALLLLYSVAFTQGANVRLELESYAPGTWFRVRFTRPTPLAPTLDAFLASFKTHWRAQDTLFELTTARDFVRLNGYELLLNSGNQFGEFAFFVRTAGTKPLRPNVAVPQAQHSVAQAAEQQDATPVFPESKETTEEAPVPTLAHLRAPRYMSIESLFPGVESTDPPVEPPETDLRNPTLVTETSASTSTPVVPLEPLHPKLKTASGEESKPYNAADADTIIIPVKIPPPKLPDRLRTPPASTSNVALTKETQTLTPIVPETKSDSAPEEKQ
jgi:hypothetical protein